VGKNAMEVSPETGVNEKRILQGREA